MLLVMSDVSGPGIAGTGLSYLTGYPLTDSGLYALSMTWPAPEMPRPGCVWTHTLLINFADLSSLDLPSALANLHVRPTSDLMAHFEKDLVVGFAKSPQVALSKSDLNFLRVLAGAIYGCPEEQIWGRRPANVDAESVVLRLWDQQWPRLRRSFRFCTLISRDRSQDQLQFDLQLTAGGAHATRLKLASNQDGVEAVEAIDQPWLNALVRDADLPTRSSLRQMLRRLGTDLLGGREAMRPLCMLHAAIESPTSALLSDAVTLLLRYPPLSSSVGAKALVVKALLSERRQLEAGEVLDFLLENYELLSEDESEQYAPRLAELVWQASPSLLIRLGETGAERVRGAIRRGISTLQRDELLAALDDSPSLAAPLLGLLPELASEQGFWFRIQTWPSNASTSDIDFSAPEVLRAVVGGLNNEGAVKSAFRVLRAPLVLEYVGELLHVDHPAPALEIWVRQACADLDGVASFLARGRTQSATLLLKIAAAIHPDAIPNDYGDDPWHIALRDLRVTCPLLPVELCAYGFRRALGWRTRSVGALFSLTFESLHNAAVQQLIPIDSWSMLEGELPWVPASEAWDKGRRLLRAVARKCVDVPVQYETFIELVDSESLLLGVFDAVWQLWSGPRYLRNVRDWLDQSTNQVHTHRRALVHQFIKSRSNLWQ